MQILGLIKKNGYIDILIHYPLNLIYYQFRPLPCNVILQ
jgi:hypothetical protein